MLIELGALCGIAAAIYWVRVARSVDTRGESVKGPNPRDLAAAAGLSALALFLACGGYLLGRLTGRF